ncbi:hypothetical protein BU17DRAFT_71530 [Hysterangium stoloniferum]|nr:hypothetical protein BU17DRAFT_71530 [Hysterangium stoloniferum]
MALSNHYEGPPLVTGNIAVIGVFLFGGLILLFLSIIALLRRKTPWVLATATAITLVLSLISYSFSIASFINQFSTRIIDIKWLRMSVTEVVFADMSDILLLVTVMLFLRERWLSQPEPYSKKKSTALVTISFAGLAVLLLAFAVASIALYAEYTAILIHPVSITELDDSANKYTNVYYVYVAIYAVATLFIAVFSIMVNKGIVHDPVTRNICHFVTPLLFLRIISAIVFTIIDSPSQFQKIVKTLKQVETIPHILNLVSGLVYYANSFFIASTLVTCLLRPNWWSYSHDTVRGLAVGGLFGVARPGALAEK